MCKVGRDVAAAAESESQGMKCKDGREKELGRDTGNLGRMIDSVDYCNASMGQVKASNCTLHTI